MSSVTAASLLSRMVSGAVVSALPQSNVAKGTSGQEDSYHDAVGVTDYPPERLGNPLLLCNNGTCQEVQTNRTLSAKEVIQGIKFAKGTEVWFYENGKLKSAKLSGDTTIQEIKFPKWTKVEFYDSGKLKSADPSCCSFGGIDIQGIPCAQAGFYENGKLSNAVLSKKAKIQGNTLAERTMVSFDENGKLKDAIFPED